MLYCLFWWLLIGLLVALRTVPWRTHRYSAAGLGGPTAPLASQCAANGLVLACVALFWPPYVWLYARNLGLEAVPPDEDFIHRDGGNPVDNDRLAS